MRAAILTCLLTLCPAVATAQTQGQPAPQPAPELPPPPPPASGEAAPPPPPAPPPEAMYPGWAAPVPQGYWQPPRYYAPRRVRYREGDPVPPGARVVTTNDRGLVVSGSLTFGVPWLISALVGSFALSDRPYTDEQRAVAWMMAPVIGPLITLATLEDVSGVAATHLVLDGITQAAGVAMLVVGLTAERRWLVFDGPTPAGARLGFAPSAAGRPGLTVGLTL